MSDELGGGYTLKDVMNEIKNSIERSDKNDAEQGKTISKILEHVKNTNGKVAQNMKDISELKTYKADNKDLATVRKYSVGNAVRDNPIKAATTLGGIITAVIAYFGGK